MARLDVPLGSEVFGSRALPAPPGAGMLSVAPTPNGRGNGSKLIGFFNPAPLEFMGGGEAMELRIASRLVDAGRRVELVSDSRAKTLSRISAEELRAQLPAPYSREPFEPGSSVDWARAGGHAMPSIASVERYDAALLLLYRVPSMNYLRRLSRLSVPVAFLVHGIAVEPHPPPSPIVRAHLVETRRRLSQMVRATRGANVRFQVLTPAAQEYLVRHGAPPQRVHWIPNCVEFPRYAIGPASERFTVLFLARLDDFQKGLRRLVRTIQLVRRSAGPELEFVILGDGRLRPWLAARLGHDDRVRLPGFVSETEKRAWLAGSSLVLSTSHLETFSVSLIEGLASGVPFVATPTAGPSSIQRDSLEFGNIGDYSAESLARLVQVRFDEWRADRDRYARRRVERRAAAGRRYDTSVQLPPYVEMVDAMLRVDESRAAPDGTPRSAPDR